MFEIDNGKLIANAHCPYVIEYVDSPNFNDRPNHLPISTIIIHNISLPPKQFGRKDRHGNHFVSALFTNTLNPKDHPYFEAIKDLKVSAHLFIQRNGHIIQFVNLNHRAWHAGLSSYLGNKNVNDFSIGIELEGDDDSHFEYAQYDALSNMIVAIYKHYPKTICQLAGHSDIAPQRKTDPGDYFDWQKLRNYIHTLLN